MRNLKDERTKIYPSTTRGGKELPSTSALDSPSVMSKLATPKPTSAMNSDMSHVIDDSTSTMHDTYDETTSMLDTTMPLGEFLDEQRARARENETIENEIIEDSDDEGSPPKYELPVVPESYVMGEETATDFLASNDRSDLRKLLAKLKQKTLNACNDSVYSNSIRDSCTSPYMDCWSLHILLAPLGLTKPSGCIIYNSL